MEAEEIVLKNLSSFCQTLPEHVEKWRLVMQQAEPIVRGIVNRGQQLCLIHGANIKKMDNFVEAKSDLESEIINGIEEDFIVLMDLFDKVDKANQLVRNSLIKFENATVNLDWETSPLTIGSATVPSLSRLLEAALDYWNHFQKLSKSIFTSTKTPEWFDEKTYKDIDRAFSAFHPGARSIQYLLAITQYVNNKNNVS
ncbi:PREDICTED: uncharacterized protein LOC108565037 isoform X2 [Nicrophorus vespilloides]|nr:PREDICTED: uncharacterized protein LOC108565037 isoform X2 [Nicrophorus vespilloides]